MLAMHGLGFGWLASVVLGNSVLGQVTQRVSVDSNGLQGNSASYSARLTSNGRFVVFDSFSSNLVPGDTNGSWCVDVFVRDRRTGSTERVSVGSQLQQGDDQSFDGCISDDGRFVAFYSNANNLVPGDIPFVGEVFLRDRVREVTERVSVSTSGSIGDGLSTGPTMSQDGRFIAFVSSSSNLVAGDSWNGVPDVFVRDRVDGLTECVSVLPNSGQGKSDTYTVTASISADGRYVVFSTYANNILPGVVGPWATVYLRDRQSGSLELISVAMNGQQAPPSSVGPSISGDGRFVAFQSIAPSLVPGDTNGVHDIFVRDRQTQTTTRVSMGWTGQQGAGHSFAPSISADGRYVAFGSQADNLVPGDTNGKADCFVHDRLMGSIERVSLGWAGIQGTGHCYLQNSGGSISADGRFVVFPSRSSNLDPSDTNNWDDVFVGDRAHGETDSLCDPVSSDVVDCPCGNAPSGSYRGCNNSAATGGANLRITGGEFLSSDTIILTTTGENPIALSLVVQGSISLPQGVIVGQGVLCVGGTFTHLYAKVASGGSVTVPDFAAGDPSVHARSEALGDPIPAGSTRWYAVLYRDRFVPGGCPTASTFNATQTRAVRWLP